MSPLPVFPRPFDSIPFSSLLESLSPLAMMTTKLSSWVTGLLTLQSALGHPTSSAPYGYPTGSPPKLEAGHLGAVASESEICSHIGIELLKQGGNAADALVGTVACVGVVGMYHSGM